METLKPNAAFLCNFEVMEILQQLKDSTQKKHKREGSLATVTYETLRYLQEMETKNHSAPMIQKCLEALKSFKLTKTEKLMILNTPPRTELEIQLNLTQTMETLKPNAAFLCNFEVMEILQQLKDSTQKKHKREGSLATVTYETLRYLQEMETKNHSAPMIQKCLEALKSFKLTKTEKLMILNTPPRTELEIQLIVQESEERLSEEDVKKIIDIVNEFLPVTS